MLRLTLLMLPMTHESTLVGMMGVTPNVVVAIPLPCKTGGPVTGILNKATRPAACVRVSWKRACRGKEEAKLQSSPWNYCSLASVAHHILLHMGGLRASLHVKRGQFISWV